MQKYIVLGNWTDLGRKTIGEIPDRIATSRKLVEEHDGSLSLCFTMGEYDFVAIIDIPDEDRMAKLMLKLNIMGFFATKTLRAWTDSELVNLIGEL